MIRLATTLLALTLLIATGPGHAAKPPPYVFGPEPDWATFRQVAEAGIAARLIDPDSARIVWTSGIYKGSYKPLLEPRAFGYVACGTVNAKNRMGGFTGAAGFIVVVDHDAVVAADIDNAGEFDTINTCRRALTTGLYPPVPASDAKLHFRIADRDGPDPAPPSASGITVRIMSEGAYVSAVAPGSAAATAGITPGMVIASVNAIPLAGLGEAMGKVIDAAGGGATLMMVGGKTVTLGLSR